MNDIFTKISVAAERDRLFQDLVKAKGELRCKAPNSEAMIRLEAHRWEPKQLVCQTVNGATLPQELPQSVVATFSVGPDRFFMTTPLATTNGGFFLLSLANDVFQLQRRQSYRLRLPESYLSTLLFISLNGEAVKLKGSLQDISTGGCRAVIKGPAPILKMDDQVEGELSIGHREAIRFKARLRHVKAETKPTNHQVAGVEFLDINAAMEAKLFALTMELHRELFSRWTDR